MESDGKIESNGKSELLPETTERAMMPAITKIAFEDFPEARRPTGRRPSQEWDAVRDLKPGEAIKFPCRWKHTVTTRWRADGQSYDYAPCQARTTIAIIARGQQRKLQSACTDKWVYVRRLEDAEEVRS